jgi:hypothetical protein
MDRAFLGVWIPAKIWLDKNLSVMEKFLLVEIQSLDKIGECYASNSHFAQFLDLSKDRVQKLVSSLANKGYISVNVIRDSSGQVIKRVIYTCGKPVEKSYGKLSDNGTPPVENNGTPPVENNACNNTSINSTKNNSLIEENLKKKTPTTTITDYTTNEELRLALLSFIDMRKSMKKPMTNRALELALKRLDNLSVIDREKIAIVEQSIERSWAGLFPLNEQNFLALTAEEKAQKSKNKTRTTEQKQTEKQSPYEVLAAKDEYFDLLLIDLASLSADLARTTIMKPASDEEENRKKDRLQCLEYTIEEKQQKINEYFNLQSSLQYDTIR